MRLVYGMVATLAMTATLATATIPAMAGGRGHDRVYADSFGNLVIDSAAGYKRIIVGEGSQAKKLREYTDAGGPEVVYADESSSETSSSASARDCYRPPALIKGRSYMYGFDEGEIPFQGGDCR